MASYQTQSEMKLVIIIKLEEDIECGFSLMKLHSKEEFHMFPDANIVPSHCHGYQKIESIANLFRDCSSYIALQYTSDIRPFRQ